MRRLVPLVWAAAGLLACGDQTKINEDISGPKPPAVTPEGPEGPETRNPLAELTANPTTGAAPLDVRLDASGSTHPDGLTLVYRFDADGDGRWDSDYGASPTRQVQLGQAGRFVLAVEVAVAEQLSLREKAVVELVVSPGNEAPVAALVLAPMAGVAPLQAELDASASTDPEGGPLEFRFDFDGDGQFDTDFDPTQTASHVYGVGVFAAMVEVRDAEGLTARASVSGPNVEAPQTAGTVNLVVDSNRDGRLDVLDEVREEGFDNTYGAVFLSNLDDDDGDGELDVFNNVVDGSLDALDLVPLRIDSIDPAAFQAATLSVEPGAGYVRIFEAGPNGEFTELLAPDAEEVAIPLGRALDLRLEGTAPRHPGFDGKVRLVLRATGQQSQEDAAELRVSPIIFTDNTLEDTRLYVMRISDPRFGENLAFFDVVAANLPQSIELYEVDEYEYLADRWVQDTMQTGYQAMVSADGVRSVHPTYLPAQRLAQENALRTLLPNELLGADIGYAYAGPSRETSLNYGGNLEVAPPHEVDGQSYPFGRLLVGGGDQGTLLGVPNSDHMQDPQRSFMDAQGVQGPSVELSTEWLAVGHIDEIFLAVPVPNAAPGVRPWKIVIASPDQARVELERLDALGLGRSTLFQGRDEETTVARILGDRSLLEYNRRAQARIDAIQEKLSEELGLTDSDFVRVPVMYEAFDFGGLDLGAALNPGIQNMVVANTTLFIPDPEGPDDNGVDAFQTLTREALEPLGLELYFVDVFESYHVNLGEAHCGTELEQVPYDTRWWEVER